MKVILLCTATMLGGLTILSAQAALAFEVASIRRANGAAGGGNGGAVMFRSGIGGDAGGYFNHVGQIGDLIQQAHRVPSVRLLGGPDWIRSDDDYYRIAAKIPDGVERTPENMAVMIRSLLAERFKLVVRSEERTVPVYVLMHAREDKRFGPNLKSTADCPQQPPFTPDSCLPRLNLNRGQNTSFEGLAPLLERVLGRPIIDRTGITGPHSWQIGQNFGPGGAAATPDDPSYFTAIQERLGLKLDSQRAPMPVVVIESIERPTEN